MFDPDLAVRWSHGGHAVLPNRPRLQEIFAISKQRQSKQSARFDSFRLPVLRLIRFCFLFPLGRLRRPGKPFDVHFFKKTTDSLLKRINVENGLLSKLLPIGKVIWTDFSSLAHVWLASLGFRELYRVLKGESFFLSFFFVRPRNFSGTRTTNAWPRCGWTSTPSICTGASLTGRPWTLATWPNRKRCASGSSANRSAGSWRPSPSIFPKSILFSFEKRIVISFQSVYLKLLRGYFNCLLKILRGFQYFFFIII